MKYGLIAGNGRFPLLALENARRLGHEVVVLAIQEEASPEVDRGGREVPLALARPA